MQLRFVQGNWSGLSIAQCRAELGVPIDLYYRNDVPLEIASTRSALPGIFAEIDNRWQIPVPADAVAHGGKDVHALLRLILSRMR